MPYLHGVYTSESATTIQPSVSADSSIPVVFGVASSPTTVPLGMSGAVTLNTPIKCSSWAEYVAVFTNAEETLTGGGTDGCTLDAFARQWFLRSGCGTAIFVPWAAVGKSESLAVTSHAATTTSLVYRALKVSVSVSGGGRAYLVEGTDYTATSTSSATTITLLSGSSYYSATTIYAEYVKSGFPTEPSSWSSTIDAVDDLYERFHVVPSVFVFPLLTTLVSENATTVLSSLEAKAESFGGGWRAVVVTDLSLSESDTHSPGSKPLVSENIVYISPTAKVGTENVPGSVVFASACAVTDSDNGGYPYVSPSNKAVPIDGCCASVESVGAWYVNQKTANDNFNAVGVVTFIRNEKGWVVWGNNTSAYPASTDPKDRFVSVRRMFNYAQNDFILFASSRVDNPINARQLQGVLNSYNQRLLGFVGAGAVASASVALDAELNTAATLLNGEVHIRVLIAPPPPMEQISAVFEYDVEGFTASLS